VREKKKMWPAEGGWRPRENGRKRMMSGGLGEPKPWGGGSFVRDRFSFRFRVFFLYFFDVSKLPPL
jgi:hypothetical protein